MNYSEKACHRGGHPCSTRILRLLARGLVSSSYLPFSVSLAGMVGMSYRASEVGVLLTRSCGRSPQQRQKGTKAWATSGQARSSMKSGLGMMGTLGRQPPRQPSFRGACVHYLTQRCSPTAKLCQYCGHRRTLGSTGQRARAVFRGPELATISFGGWGLLGDLGMAHQHWPIQPTFLTTDVCGKPWQTGSTYQCL